VRLLVGLLVLAALALWAWSLPSERARAVRGEGVVPAEAEGGRAPAPPPAPAEAPGERTAPGTPIPPAPEDPVEEGECSLHIALADRDSGRELAGSVALYRLDAPGNEHWTRGDQLQCMVDVAVGGTLVEKLPGGAYRIFCLDQPAKSEDPEAFLVSGALTRRTFAIPSPRWFEAWLVVVDENGRRFDRGRLRGGGRYHTDRSMEPGWRVARALREPDKYFTGRGFGAGAMGGRSVRAATAVDGRFPLGRYLEDARRRVGHVRWSWQSPERTEVRVEIDQAGARPREYGGISIPIDPIRRSILLPDGGSALERGARIEAWHDAAEGRPPEPALAVIRVRATLNGHEPLEFEMRADDPPPVRTMVAKGAE